MDTSCLPLILLQSEDKAMPLDLSCKKVSDDERDEDEVIVTLEIPGRKSHATSHEPIVIPSDSDSDSDVTVVAAIMKPPKLKKGTKLFDAQKSLTPTSVDSGSDMDDCIVSSYHVPFPQVKRIYDPLQTARLTPVMMLDPMVKGKDPFLSDASNSDDLQGLIMSSPVEGIASDDKNNGIDFEDSVSPISMRLALLSAKNVMTPSPASVDGVADGVDSPDSDIAKTTTSKLTAGTQQSIGDLMSGDTMSRKSPSLVATSDCASSDGLTFGITQLLSSPCKASSGATLVKDSKSTTVDVSSVFQVQSLDQLFSGAPPSGIDDRHFGKSDNTSSIQPKINDSSSSDSKTSCCSGRLRHCPLRTRASRSSYVDPLGGGGAYPKSPNRSSPHPITCNNVDSSPNDVVSAKEDWKVIHNNYKNKVVLRRSPDGKVVSVRKRDPSNVFGLSPVSVRKKPRMGIGYPLRSHRPSPSSASTLSFDDQMAMTLAPSRDYDPQKLDSEPESKSSYCYGCKAKLSVGRLSFCMAGHGCCGQCLQTQVKTLLARGKRGTLKCRYVGCNSFYLVSQLHNALPAMVIEILEEKLDREYFDNAAELMMADVDKSMTELVAEETIDGQALDRTTKDPKEEHNLPPGWEPMSQTEEYRLVDLLRGSEEYNYVSTTFHLTMHKPRASVVKIQRVQNAILWEFYMVRKKQMERDNGKQILEKNLFHGTQKNVVEAICRTNFDWRLCGSHGTMYGQGSYFARDAAYSHMYTDQPPQSRHQTISIHSSNNPMIFNAPPPPSHHSIASASSGATAAQIIFHSFPGTSHSVSIAALQSCRFARLPVLNNHLTHAPPPPPPPPSAAQGSSSSAPVPTHPQVSAFSFPYWLGNGSGVSGPSVGQNKLGRNDVAGGSVGPLAGPSAAPHVHTMFLARVLVGEYTTGKGSYRKPPAIDPAAPYGRCYDACVNDMSNPSIYVIFNSAQCYPEYIIEYTNKPRDAM